MKKTKRQKMTKSPLQTSLVPFQTTKGCRRANLESRWITTATDLTSATTIRQTKNDYKDAGKDSSQLNLISNKVPTLGSIRSIQTPRLCPGWFWTRMHRTKIPSLSKCQIKASKALHRHRRSFRSMLPKQGKIKTPNASHSLPVR